MQYKAKDLFQLQTELVEAKVDMAVSHAIDRVLDRIDGLQKDMDTRFITIDKRFSSMDERFSSLKEDMSAVKTKLGMTDGTRDLIRAKFIDYAFKTGWMILATIGLGLSYLILHTHFFS